VNCPWIASLRSYAHLFPSSSFDAMTPRAGRSAKMCGLGSTLTTCVSWHQIQSACSLASTAKSVEPPPSRNWSMDDGYVRRATRQTRAETSTAFEMGRANRYSPYRHGGGVATTASLKPVDIMSDDDAHDPNGIIESVLQQTRPPEVGGAIPRWPAGISGHRMRGSSAARRTVRVHLDTEAWFGDLCSWCSLRGSVTVGPE